MAVSFQSLAWRPIVEGKTAVMFVALGMACAECARVIVYLTDAFEINRETREIKGGCINNVHWRTKGMDAAAQCDFCGKDLSDCAAEELRFWVDAETEMPA